MRTVRGSTVQSSRLGHDPPHRRAVTSTEHVVEPHPGQLGHLTATELASGHEQEAHVVVQVRRLAAMLRNRMDVDVELPGDGGMSGKGLQVGLLGRLAPPAASGSTTKALAVSWPGL